MTTTQKIWQFINFNNPTEEHLITTLELLNIEDTTHELHGWIQNGHITKQGMNYYITSESLKDGTGDMDRQLSTTVSQLQAENRELRYKLERIYSLSNLH